MPRTVDAIAMRAVAMAPATWSDSFLDGTAPYTVVIVVLAYRNLLEVAAPVIIHLMEANAMVGKVAVQDSARLIVVHAWEFVVNSCLRHIRRCCHLLCVPLLLHHLHHFHHLNYHLYHLHHLLRITPFVPTLRNPLTMTAPVMMHLMEANAMVSKAAVQDSVDRVVIVKSIAPVRAPRLAHYARTPAHRMEYRQVAERKFSRLKNLRFSDRKKIHIHNERAGS